MSRFNRRVHFGLVTIVGSHTAVCQRALSHRVHHIYRLRSSLHLSPPDNSTNYSPHRNRVGTLVVRGFRLRQHLRRRRIGVAHCRERGTLEQRGFMPLTLRLVGNVTKTNYFSRCLRWGGRLLIFRPEIVGMGRLRRCLSLTGPFTSPGLSLRRCTASTRLTTHLTCAKTAIFSSFTSEQILSLNYNYKVLDLTTYLISDTDIADISVSLRTLRRFQRGTIQILSLRNPRRIRSRFRVLRNSILAVRQ